MRLITTKKILNFFSCLMECETKNSVNNTLEIAYLELENTAVHNLTFFLSTIKVEKKTIISHKKRDLFSRFKN